VLFKSNIGRFDFRALFGEANGQMVKLYGNGPNLLEEVNIDKFFKYSSGQRTFIEVSGQKSLTITTDGIMLKKIKK